MVSFVCNRVSVSKNKRKSCVNNTVTENAELSISENIKFIDTKNVNLSTLLLLGIIYTLKLKLFFFIVSQVE
jgi:hypothetical protein